MVSEEMRQVMPGEVMRGKITEQKVTCQFRPKEAEFLLSRHKDALEDRWGRFVEFDQLSASCRGDNEAWDE